MGKRDNRKSEVKKKNIKIDWREERKFRDSEKKLNAILRKIHFTSFEKRIKMKLLEEYSNGRFFDIPAGLFDVSQKDDREVIKILQHKFENSSEIPTFIPENLYDPNNLIDTHRLRSIMEKNGVYVSLDLDELFLLPYNSAQKRQIFDLAKTNISSKSINKHRYVYIRNEKERIEENALKTIKAGYMSEGKDKISNQGKQGVYERRLYIYLMDVFHGVSSISGNDIEDLLNKLESLDELYVGNRILVQKNFLRKRDESIRKISDSAKKVSDNEKDTLFSIMDILKECGALEELIKKENELVAYLNKFLPEKSKLESFDEKDLEREIKELDANQLGDLEILLLHNRHFANKIAHIYEDYMFTNVFVNAISSDEIFGNTTRNIPSIKEKNILEHFRYVDQFISKNFYTMDTAKRERLKNAFVRDTLKLSSEYLEKKALLEDNKENVLRRMKIALILNPSKYEIDNFKSLINIEERITSQEFNALRSKSGTNEELDEIIKKVLRDDESKVLLHIEKNKYNKTRDEANSIKNKITEVADKIIEDKITITIANQIIRDIAISKRKNIDFKNVIHDINLSINDVIAFYGLTQKEVLSELCMRKESVLNKLPQDVRKLPPKHNKLKEELRKVTLAKKERILVECEFGTQDEKEAEKFLEKMMNIHNGLKDAREDIIKLCDRPIIKGYDEKARYCKAITNQFKMILDDYYDYMTKEIELGRRDNFPSAFEVITLLLNKTSKQDSYTKRDKKDIDILNELKQIRIERNFTQVSFVELVKEFEKDVTKDGVIKNVYDVFSIMAGQVDLDKCLFNIKHKATTELLHVAQNDPDIFIEGNLPTEYQTGLINVLIDGGYQKNSCHNKYAELPDLLAEIGDVVEEPKVMEDYYKQEEKNKYPLNTYIYQSPLSDMQREGFQTVAKIIGSIEGKYEFGENELNEEGHAILRSLKTLKEDSPMQYGSLTPRFLLGAGIDYYRSYYGSIDKPFAKVVEDKERLLNNRILVEENVELAALPENEEKVIYLIGVLKTAFSYVGLKDEAKRIISKLKLRHNDKEEK